MTTPTRERLIDEAMTLFGRQGYRATSVAQIEKAAGLTPGSGGLYHHFRSKEQLLEAGVERHLGRLRALGDIRRIFEGLADLRSELTVLGRFTLQVIDDEAQLLRIVAAESRGEIAAESRGGIAAESCGEIAAESARTGTGRLADTCAGLLDDSYRGLADWVARRAPGMSSAQAEALAVVALNVLMAHRTTPQFLGVRPLLVDDDALITEWVEMVAGRIETFARS